jgi:excisionase family DNA binding protein
MDSILITMQDASKMTGLSKSTLYKKTAKREISFYKPFGKKIFFSREQLEQMMKQNLMRSGKEISEQTLELLISKNGGKNV